MLALFVLEVLRLVLEMKIEKSFVCRVYSLKGNNTISHVNKFIIIFQKVVSAVRINEWSVR